MTTALELSGTRKDFLYTESGVLIPPVGSHGVCFWYYHPAAASVTSEWTLLHMDTDGADNSEVRIFISTDGKLNLYTSDSTTNNATDASTGVIAEGWHHLVLTWNGGAGTVIIQLDGGTNIGVSIASVNAFDTKPTRLILGSKLDRTGPIESGQTVKIVHYAVHSNVYTTQEKTDLYNSGAPGDPTTEAGSCTGFCDMQLDLIDSTGSGEWASPRRPTFVDATDLMGGTFTAYDLDSIDKVTGAGELPSSGNYDLVMLGDSFAINHLHSRLSLHLADQLALKAGVSFGAFAEGAFASGQGISNSTLNSKTGGTFNELKVATLEMETASDGSATAVYWGVPINAVAEHYTDGPPTGTNFGTQGFQSNTTEYDGPLGEWLDGNPACTVEIMIRQPTVNPIASVVLTDGTASLTVSDMDSLTAEATHLLGPISVTPSGTAIALDIRPDGAWPTNKYLAWCGGRCKVTSVVDAGVFMGLYGIADGSWSYNGFAGGHPTSGSDKSFSQASFEDWIGTYYDTNRTWVFCINFATENLSQAHFETRVGDIIDACETARASLSIPASKFKYLLLSQFMHSITGTTPNADREAVENSVRAFDALQAARDRVCHASIYLMTDGNYFHDGLNSVLGPNGTTGPQYQWVSDFDTENSTSYLATVNGTLLDTADLHLGQSDAAQLMAKEVANEIDAAQPVASTIAKRLGLGVGLGVGIGNGI